MTAKYYIYRNLHTGGFSVRHRGRVVDRIESAFIENANFKVNKRGRERAVNEGQRNVHAYIVCDKYQSNIKIKLGIYRQISYNPFRSDSFTMNGKQIWQAGSIVLYHGQCYKT